MNLIIDTLRGLRDEVETAALIVHRSVEHKRPLRTCTARECKRRRDMVRLASAAITFLETQERARAREMGL